MKPTIFKPGDVFLVTVNASGGRTVEYELVVLNATWCRITSFTSTFGSVVMEDSFKPWVKHITDWFEPELAPTIFKPGDVVLAPVDSAECGSNRSSTILELEKPSCICFGPPAKTCYYHGHLGSSDPR